MDIVIIVAFVLFGIYGFSLAQRNSAPMPSAHGQPLAARRIASLIVLHCQGGPYLWILVGYIVSRICDAPWWGAVLIAIVGGLIVAGIAHSALFGLLSLFVGKDSKP
jgi:hypothetical protein